MEKLMKAAFFLVVIVVAMGNEASAEMKVCNMSETDLNACKPAVSSGLKHNLPTNACCTALAGADMACLCEYKRKNYFALFGIDPQLAMQLPEKCNLPPANC